VNSPSDQENTPFGFNRKNLELSASGILQRELSQSGYEAEWMDEKIATRHTLWSILLYIVGLGSNSRPAGARVYQQSDRTPDNYQSPAVVDEAGNPVTCTDTTTFFTGGPRAIVDSTRRLVSAIRAMHWPQYDLTDKVTVSGFFGTVQDNYNRRGGTNSPVPLNFIPGTTNPYYCMEC